jgi:phosphatidylserine decarboxylase
MAREPIRYLDRYTGRLETEAVYGEAWLRWAYETHAGRFALAALAARPWFSRWYGWRMSQSRSRSRIRPFLRRFGIDTTEFLDSPDSFRNFNAFFTRRLRPESRPVHPDPRAAVFPADGRHLGFANLHAAHGFYLKGQRFDLPAFLADDSLARRFAGGAAVFSRLCPVDYHRFHFPVAGEPTTPVLLNGWLWSVNPVALRRDLSYLWQNRRWRSEIQRPSGKVLMVEIGATNVGSVEYTFTPGVQAARGDEKGFFQFGGSAILTLFEPGRIRLCDDLLAATADRHELYARVGDVMGWMEPSPAEH